MESFVREVDAARSEVEAVNPEADSHGLEVVPIKSDGDPFSLRTEWGGRKGESAESKVVPSHHDMVPVVHKVASDGREFDPVAPDAEPFTAEGEPFNPEGEPFNPEGEPFILESAAFSLDATPVSC